MRFNLPLTKAVEGEWCDWDVKQSTFISSARCFEAETHAVGPPLSIQQQVLVGLQLKQHNVAEIGDFEVPSQAPVAELNRIEGLADQTEEMFEFSGGLKNRVDTLLRLTSH